MNEEKKMEYGGRVSIDEERIRQAREIQANRYNLARIKAARDKINSDKLIHKIELLLIEEGQHDLQFKLGDVIKYTPYEVAKILRKHADELQV